MTEEKLPMSISISRPRGRDIEKHIRISIKDEKSGSQVVEVNVSLENFAECLTGLAFVECEGEIGNNLDRIGKTKEIDYITFPMPKDSTYSCDEKKLAASIAKREIAENCEDGWELWDSFSSQNSFSYDGKGVTTARATIVRWVEKKE
jgi:hypothetical protein